MCRRGLDPQQKRDPVTKENTILKCHKVIFLGERYNFYSAAFLAGFHVYSENALVDLILGIYTSQLFGDY